MSSPREKEKGIKELLERQRDKERERERDRKTDRKTEREREGRMTETETDSAETEEIPIGHMTFKQCRINVNSTS